MLAGTVLLGIVLDAPGVTFPLRWRWSNPRPHGGNIVDMTVRVSLTNTLAIQVADRGQIFSSADLTLWVPEESGTSNDLQAVTFLSHSSNRILVSGESGTVLYADWPGPYRPGTLLDGPTGDWLVAIAVSENPQLRLAVAVGDNGAVYTSTNGIHWKRQSSGTSLWLLGVAWGTNGFSSPP